MHDGEEVTLLTGAVEEAEMALGVSQADTSPTSPRQPKGLVEAAAAHEEVTWVDDEDDEDDRPGDQEERLKALADEAARVLHAMKAKTVTTAPALPSKLQPLPSGTQQSRPMSARTGRTKPAPVQKGARK